MSPEVWIGRHGRVDAAGRCYGWADVPAVVPPGPIADAWVEQIGAVPDTLWTSDLSRTRAIAGELERRWQRPLREDTRLRELGFGAWEGRTWDEIHATEPDALARWGAGWRDAPPPGGESASDLEARVGAWIAALGAGRHVAVAHAGTVRAAWVVTGRLGWEEAMATPVPWASVWCVSPARSSGSP